jgi:hypothetical protein
MARRARILLFPGRAEWRIVLADAERRVLNFQLGFDAAPRQAADAVAAAVRSAGVSSADVLLALPSAWCLSATLATADLPAKARRRALLYRFEESLPLAAEEVRADFIEIPGSAMGVCASRRLVDPLMAALRAAGLNVVAMCPAAVLELEAAVERADSSTGDVWRASGRDGEIDLFHLRDGRPTSWALLPAEPGALAAHLRLERLGRSEPSRLLSSRLSTETIGRIDGMEIVTELTETEDTATTKVAEAILSGRRSAWIDLSRGESADADETLRRLGRPLTAAVVCVAACLTCVAASLLIRAERYDRAATAWRDQQRDVFRRVFPNGTPPADVRSRLMSEERSLRAAGGEGASAAPPSGLIVLRDLVNKLPDTRFRIQEIRVEEGKFTLEGQAKSHDDADAIAEAVSAGGRFAADPPRTEQLAGQGVSFTLGGAVVSPRSIRAEGAR